MRAEARQMFADVIAHAIERGLIRPPAEKPLTPGAYRMREMRARYHQRGLNSRGKPYKKVARPELAGLPRGEYLRRYMQMWRNK